MACRSTHMMLLLRGGGGGALERGIDREVVRGGTGQYPGWGGAGGARRASTPLHGFCTGPHTALGAGATAIDPGFVVTVLLQPIQTCVCE